MIVVLTVLSLVLGIAYGYLDVENTFISMISQNTQVILYVLMFSVGISIGMHDGIMKKLKEYHVKIFIIPVGIILGSLFGGLLCAAIFKISVGHATAIASGLAAELKVLSSDACRALLIRAKHGDTDAREQLIAGNLRLVLSVIQKFIGRGENVDDLFQVGCIGLIKAIDHFDAENHDVRFSTYGVPMISGEIRRYLRDNSPIRVSRSTRDTAYKVLQTKERLTAASGREPTLDEIAKELDIPRRDVVFALDAISDPISLFEPIYTDNGESICVMDQVGDTKNTDEQWLEHLALSNAISDLNEREKKILSLRFYAGKTQMEVAGEIGISQAQVSRLEKNALGKIRKNIFPS